MICSACGEIMTPVKGVIYVKERSGELIEEINFVPLYLCPVCGNFEAEDFDLEVSADIDYLDKLIEWQFVGIKLNQEQAIFWDLILVDKLLRAVNKVKEEVKSDSINKEVMPELSISQMQEFLDQWVDERFKKELK